MVNNDDDELMRAMAALETMADLWGAEVNLRNIAAHLATTPIPRRKESIAAMMRQAFVEGAYRCYCDAKDGKIPNLMLRPPSE